MSSERSDQEIRILIRELEQRKHREIYEEKEIYLREYQTFTNPMDFYRDVFPVGSFERWRKFEDRKGNGIAVDLSDIGKPRRYIITDDLEKLEELMGRPFVILAPIAYNGRNRSSKNARHIHAVTFDLDGVGVYQLKNLLHQMDSGLIPRASYLANSGTGVHLYYILQDPLPAYPDNQRFLKELKYALTRRIWNEGTSTVSDPQYQTIAQGFRMVGTSSKLGVDYPVTVYRIGKTVTVDDLFSYIPTTSGEREKITKMKRKSGLSLEEAKEKWPDWYERKILGKGNKPRWNIKRDLYDWWLRRIKEEIKVGHRYFGIMTLAIYAKKCNVEENELRRDAFGLLEHFDAMTIDTGNSFTEDDIVAALALYDEDYITFPRDDIAKISGLSMPVNKRNGRNRFEHLKRARMLRDLDYPDGSWRNKEGRPTKKHIIKEYVRENPGITNKSAIARATGTNRTTVLKYYDEIKKELE